MIEEILGVSVLIIPAIVMPIITIQILLSGENFIKYAVCHLLSIGTTFMFLYCLIDLFNKVGG